VELRVAAVFHSVKLLLEDPPPTFETGGERRTRLLGGPPKGRENVFARCGQVKKKLRPKPVTGQNTETAWKSGTWLVERLRPGKKNGNHPEKRQKFEDTGRPRARNKLELYWESQIHIQVQNKSRKRTSEKDCKPTEKVQVGDPRNEESGNTFVDDRQSPVFFGGSPVPGAMGLG